MQKTTFIKNFILSFSFALLSAIFLIFYNKAVITQGSINYLSLLNITICSLASVKVILVILVMTLFIYLCLTQYERVSKFVFKYRFLLCLITFTVLVGFGISGSSIGAWSTNTGSENTGLLAGLARSIRSDEWLVSTPMALSQYNDLNGSFSYYSEIIRGSTTDAFIQSRLPVRDVVAVFRPFHLGFLFLPPSQGLSFYWSGKLIGLFIVSFEMGRFITNDKRHLALIYAFLLTFAPSVQWWFSTELTELLIYSQLATLAFREFLISNEKTLKRVICVCVICICVGGFTLALYPVWQIPIAYVILALELWVFFEHRKTFKITGRQVFFCSCCIAIFVLTFARVIFLSKETITTIMNTAYPGARETHGGGSALSLFNYCASIFFPIKTGDEIFNVCNQSTFIDFFPAPIIIPFYVMIARKNKDFLLTSLTIVFLFLLGYCVIGYPHILEKVTLLYMSKPHRIAQILGFPGIILLIRSLSMIKINKHKYTIIIPMIFSLFIVIVCYKYAIPGYLSIKFTLISFLVFSMGLYFLLNHDKKRVLCTSFFVGLMIFAGGLANPIQKGLDCIYNNNVYNMVNEITKKDSSSLWISESSLVLGDFIITAGAPSINSTNPYPNLDRWQKLDNDGSHDEVYNRFAHIIINLKTTGSAEWELIQEDVISITLTPYEAKEIGAKYIITTNNLEESLNDGAVSLTNETGNFKIYELL